MNTNCLLMAAAILLFVDSKICLGHSYTYLTIISRKAHFKSDMIGYQYNTRKSLRFEIKFLTGAENLALITYCKRSP